MASELICVRFGQTLCGLLKKHLGFFFRTLKLKVGDLRLGKNANSLDLDYNLRLMGVFRPPATQAHHIVGQAYATKEGADAIRILNKYNINFNSPINGVYLPDCKNDMSAVVHCGSHTAQYAKRISDLLVNADIAGGRNAVLRELDSIRRSLLNGDVEFILNARGVNP